MSDLTHPSGAFCITKLKSGKFTLTLNRLSRRERQRGTYIRWVFRNRCARKEQALLFDLFKAFDEIGCIYNNSPTSPTFLHACATCSEIPSDISTMGWTMISTKQKTRFRHVYFFTEPLHTKCYSLSLSLSLYQTRTNCP